MYRDRQTLQEPGVGLRGPPDAISHDPRNRDQGRGSGITMRVWTAGGTVQYRARGVGWCRPAGDTIQGALWEPESRGTHGASTLLGVLDPPSDINLTS